MPEDASPEQWEAEDLVTDLFYEEGDALEDGKLEEDEEARIEEKRDTVLAFLEESGDLEDNALRIKALQQAVDKVAGENSGLISEGELYGLIFGVEATLLFIEAETDPESVFVKCDKFKNEPYATALLELVIQTAYKKDSDLLLKYASTYVHLPIAEGLIREVASTPYSTAALTYYYQYKDQPYADEVLEKAVQLYVTYYRSGSLLEYAAIIKDKPYGEELIRSGCEKDPWLAFEYTENFVDQPYAEELIRTAAERDPLLALQNAAQFNSQSYAKEVIGKAAEKDPVSALICAKGYFEMPYAKEIIEKAARWCAQQETGLFFRRASLFIDEPYAEALIKEAAKRDPDSALIAYYIWEWTPFAEEVATAAAKKAPVQAMRNIDPDPTRPYTERLFEEAARSSVSIDPHSVLKQFELLVKQPYGEKLVVAAALRVPEETMYEYNRNPFFKEILSASTDPAVQKFIELMSQASFKEPRVSLLLEAIVNENMSLERAEAIVEDPAELLKELIRLRAKNPCLADYEIDRDLKYLALQEVRTINDLHNETAARRFESVEAMDAKSLFLLMTYGEEEIFTSSFNGLFDRMLVKRKAENISGDVLLNQLGYTNFRVFVKLCAGFNRLEEFLSTMEASKRSGVLKKFVEGIEKSPNPLQDAVTVADAFSVIKDEALLAELQRSLKQEYTRVQSEGHSEGLKIYGLLSGMFGSGRVFTEPAWFESMAKQYAFENVSHLRSAELFNPNGLNVQQHFFYNDEDGAASFRHFLSFYSSSPGWKVESKEKYVLISSVKDGRKVEIYANKPTHEEDGPDEIEEILEQKNIETLVVVHRGHSYHAQQTINRITDRARIVSLGSCGGYNNVENVLSRSPKAHILSTKGTGTMSVNDPLLKMMNEEILSGHDLDWPDLWSRAEAKLGSNPNFENYVPPHKNLGAMFLKAYRNLDIADDGN